MLDRTTRKRLCHVNICRESAIRVISRPPKCYYTSTPDEHFVIDHLPDQSKRHDRCRRTLGARFQVHQCAGRNRQSTRARDEKTSLLTLSPFGIKLASVRTKPEFAKLSFEANTIAHRCLKSLQMSTLQQASLQITFRPPIHCSQKSITLHLVQDWLEHLDKGEVVRDAASTDSRPSSESNVTIKQWVKPSS